MQPISPRKPHQAGLAPVIIIAIVFGVLALGGGAYYLSRNGSIQDTTATEGATGTGGTGGSGTGTEGKLDARSPEALTSGAEVSWSVEQILGVSESLECTWRPPQEPMKGFEEGKLWTSGGKGRSTATFVLNAGPAEANAIYDGESVTGWFEVMGVKQGFRMNKAELDAANESMTQQEREQAEQYRSEMIVSCKPWNPDPSFFVVPSDVSFDLPVMPGT
jgi:hypothetical protein